VQINGNSILLGLVYAFFTNGALVGPPDHVKVVSDSGNDVRDRDCGFPIRTIKLLVVDQPGRRAVALLSSIGIRERFFAVEGNQAELGGVWSTCTNNYSSPSGCSPHSGGTFQDEITPGCSPYSSAPCGVAEFINKWIWCPRGRPEKVLATNVYDNRSDYVLINGLPKYDPGTELR